MRYRPFGRSGCAVSALTLAVGEAPSGEAARMRLVHAALEAGVNAFELRSLDPDVARGLGKALHAVERRLVLTSLRLPAAGLTADALVEAIEATVLNGRFGKLDAVILEDPGEAALALVPTIQAAQAAGRLGMAGAAGEGSEAALASGAYGLLGAAYHLGSSWVDRHHIKRAVEQGAGVIGHGHHPAAAAAGVKAPPARSGLFGLGRKPAPIEGADAYAFLRHTPGWSAEEICLAYALLEPALSTVVIEARSPEEVGRLAETPERELPTGLPAQIEMARFALAV